MRIVSRVDRDAGDSIFSRVTFESRARIAEKTVRIYKPDSETPGLDPFLLYVKAVEADRDIAYSIDSAKWREWCESGFSGPKYKDFGDWLDAAHAKEWFPELRDHVRFL
jgi:hypothetical protein